ncbi:MAG TPA: molybdenum ABC transporter ATP-binding protein [Ottowia sp.]|uniref:molybdenum ABC transporter ATP-binding protein n=1 Tax=Ottowia sp. TaxID=1898956 RepID=UPI002B948D96|nr:molybdenum ABC transporter ATP-binding protein [Ottowia sp.]HMN21590.1 molybdenum ABC transporter ATP-binding protein [Ottowia sp.]
MPGAADTLELRAQLRYGAAFALDVDVRLPGRGVSAVFGPSGCGKTTLLRCVAGLTRPDAGRVVVNGEAWHDDARDLWLPTHRRALGLVFQEASLFPHLSVQANLDFGRKRVPPAERRVSLEQAIELLGIGHLLARRPAGLSGGERQRVAIARALATSPRLLLMDEPLASLDLARKAELLPWFERLARELQIPVLYVTHALDEVARLADHLLLLQDGRVRAHGPTAQVLGRLDVAHQHGDAAGTLIEGRLQAIDADDQLLHVGFAGGELQCLHARDTPLPQIGARLRLRVLARDVSLALAARSDTSILNILPATVRELSGDGPGQVLVALDLAGVPLLARITSKSARALQLAPGQHVFAQIKGVGIVD